MNRSNGGIDASTVADLRLGGAPDAEIFGAAVAGGFCVLTKNVGDFARIAAEHSTGGGHHPGLLTALSSRFSRRPACARLGRGPRRGGADSRELIGGCDDRDLRGLASARLLVSFAFGDAFDLRDEIEGFAAIVADQRDGQHHPDQMSLGVVVALLHLVCPTAAGQHLLDEFEVAAQVARVRDVLEGADQQRSLGVSG